MRTSTILLSCTLAIVGLSAGCATEKASGQDSAASDSLVGDTRSASITEDDRVQARSLKQMFVLDPKLNPGAVAEVIEEGAFDGTRSSTTLVKDTDGRRFLVFAVDSRPEDSALAGSHGQPPAFADARYFLLLDARGVEWAIANVSTVASKRHAQILAAMTDADQPVTDLGTTPDGRRILHFLTSLFLVAPGGMDDRCRSDAEDCAGLWQRIAVVADPFDAPSSSEPVDSR